MVKIDAPWSVEINELIKRLDVNPSIGLSLEEAKQRLKEYGLNCFTGSKPEVSEKVTVLRESKEIEIDATELVPGDIIKFETSEELSIIQTPNGPKPAPHYNLPADGRLIETKKLEVMETHLTGSCTPSIKDATIISLPADYSVFKEDIPNMIFSHTQLYKGKGKAIIVATGMNTVISEIMVPLDLPKGLKKKLKMKKKR